MNNSAIDLMREELIKKSIPLNELIAFKKEIENQIKLLQDDMIKQFREKALANGIELEFIAGELTKPSIEQVTPNKLAPKYKNPNDESQTWCGKGKKPKWITELLATGKQLDDLKIQS